LRPLLYIIAVAAAICYADERIVHRMLRTTQRCCYENISWYQKDKNGRQVYNHSTILIFILARFQRFLLSLKFKT